METFADEQHQNAHHDFVRWIDRHYYTGYVVNYGTRGAMGHRARCGHFKHGNKKHSLTARPKVCFQNRTEYDEWSQQNGTYPGNPKRCPDCM